jgi:hypothetical protein
MPTFITIHDEGRIYSTSFAETMPLDIGMLDANNEFRYSLGTLDVEDVHSQMNIMGLVKTLKYALKNRSRVEFVELETAVESVKFLTPLLTFHVTDDKEYFLEISSNEVKTSVTQSGVRRHINTRVKH